jgi:sarcosine oxidase subunit alpha
VADSIEIVVDGLPIRVAPDVSLAAALLNTGLRSTRRAVGGDARGPLCGMGTCFECRVTIDGVAHRRACLEPVRSGMEVETGG